MKNTPRWLQVLGILAVGFVIGRYTAEPRAEVSAGQPLIVETDPVSVPVAASETGVAVEPRNTDEGVEVDGQNPASTPVGVAESNAGSAEPAAMAEEALAPYVGTWYAEVHGTRMTTLKPDGTGVVHAKLDWVAALLYGSELHINVDWTVNGDVMTHTITSGTPKKNIDALTKDFGTSKDYRIDKMDDKSMTLIDPGDGEVIVWHRREDGAKL